jgi:hypothetical protein
LQYIQKEPRAIEGFLVYRSNQWFAAPPRIFVVVRSIDADEYDSPQYKRQVITTHQLRDVTPPIAKASKLN